MNETANPFDVDYAKRRKVWIALGVLALAILIACAVLYVRVSQVQDRLEPTRIQKSSDQWEVHKQIHDAAYNYGVDCLWVSDEDCSAFTARVAANDGLRESLATARSYGVTVFIDSSSCPFWFCRRNKTRPGIITVDPSQADQSIIDYLNGK